MKVVLDIETVQIPKAEWAGLAGVSITDPQDLLEIAEGNQQDKDYEKSAFDGTFSRIICIGLIVLTDSLEPQGSIAWYGANEPELLKQFWAKIGQLRPALYITHNGLGFDLPFIKKRSIIHQVKPAADISLAKFRTEPVYDTLAVWSNWEQRGWIKLDVLARALDVESKSGSGKQVGEMWVKGLGKDIAEYCLQDTYVTYACYCRMNFRQLHSRDVVLFHRELIEAN